MVVLHTKGWFMLVIIVVLSALLILSIALNYNFYHRAFLHLHQTKLDPLGLQRYPLKPTTNDNIASNDKKVVMFYGDSRAFAWPDLQGESVDKLHFVNRGIAGQTSIQIVNRFAYHVVPYKPDVIIVQVCVNELKLVSVLSTQKDDILRDCKQNLQQLVQQAHAIQATVILTTVFPISDIDLVRRLLGFKEKPIIEAIDEINAFIKTLAAENTVIFDSDQLLKQVGEESKINKTFSEDWLHLNPQGYAHLNRSLRDVLARFNHL